MKIQKHGPVESGLPPDDTHPYRSGPWRPQVHEYDAWDLEVEGHIPEDLAGVYLRNTENALFEPVQRYHPFDGDGLMHAMSFDNGQARYASRFVKTDGFRAEQQACESLWAGIAENPGLAKAETGSGARTMMKDNGSTDVVVHRGSALASFYQCGKLWAMDPITLEDQGPLAWNGWFPSDGVSAHQKVDAHTGDLLFFNYTTTAPYMHYGVVDRDGTLANWTEIPLAGSRLPHDMAFTENWSILNEFPLGWDPQGLADGYYKNRFFNDTPTRFALIPRHGSTDQIRWFEADPTFVLHWANAYEDGDEVVLDGFFQHNPACLGYERPSPDFKGFESLDINAFASRAHRWRFNLATGQTREESLTDTVTEFPMINGRYGGRRHRYIYEARGAHGLFAFNGLIKRDVESGTEELFEFEPGVFVSETVMAPRVGSRGEDDGYLITFSIDVNADESQCLIFDAAQLAAGPVTRIRLPERICSGTHATWASAEDLANA